VTDDGEVADISRRIVFHKPDSHEVSSWQAGVMTETFHIQTVLIDKRNLSTDAGGYGNRRARPTGQATLKILSTFSGIWCLLVKSSL